MPFTFCNAAGRAALVAGDAVFDLETVSGGAVPSDPMGALHAAADLHRLASELSDHEPTGSLDTTDVGPPVPAPRNCYGIGLNYRSHAAEAEMELPSVPMVFTKFPSCIAAPGVEVEMRSDTCDYEVELVVVIGDGGKDIAPADAWGHVLGLTVGQDISDRAAQFMSKPAQFNLGKSFDTFGPMGPVLVSTDSFADPADLEITCAVNGEERQRDRTSNMIFDVPTLVSFLSSITTLRTGDVIFTGTPEGVGAVRRVYLTDGDEITSNIEGIGTITNRCRRVSDYR